MLTPDDFEELRREICASGRASGGDNLVGMAIDFDLCPGASEDADAVPGLWQDLDVQRQPGARWLITGRATGSRQDADAIRAELARAREEDLRYRHRAGHTIETGPDHITFRAVTQIGPGDFWVTAIVQVDLA